MPPKVDKEVIFFLVSTGKQPSDGDANYFEKAKEAMTLITEKKILLRPHDEVGIMLAAPCDDDAGGGNACTKLYRENLVPTWETVKDIQKLQTCDKVFKDWNTALFNILEQIRETVVDANRIILILLFDCHATCPNIDEIDPKGVAKAVMKHAVQLLWIGSKPLKELPKTRLNASEKLLMEVVKKAGGEYMTIEQTLPSLRIFKNNKVRFVGWRTDLEIGDIKIPICMYVQTARVMKTPSFTTIKTQVNYGGEKSVAAGKEREYVDRYKQSYAVQDTIPGYMYGRKCIPVPEADKAGMEFKSGPKSFKVWGFASRNSISLEDLCGQSTHMVVPQSPAAAKALYCFAQAMTDYNRVAIVRRVYAMNNCPKMGMLFPHMEFGEPWGFVHVEMTFAEDRRTQVARPFSSIVSRLSQAKKDAVESLIDSMMLTGSADHPEPFRPGTVHSPGLQHMWNCLAHRALHPDKPLPDLDENLKKLIDRPESLKVDSERVMKKLRNLFPIPGKPDSRKDQKDAKTPEVSAPLLCEVKKTEPKIEEKIVPCAEVADALNFDLDELFDEDMAM